MSSRLVKETQALLSKEKMKNSLFSPTSESPYICLPLKRNLLSKAKAKISRHIWKIGEVQDKNK